MAIPKPRTRLVRPTILPGRTYKIHPPTIDEAVYITINDAEMDDKIRPVEIFINSKHVGSFAWAQALMRLLSAQLQQPGDFPAFVIHELTASMDPDGSYFIPPNSCGNRSPKGKTCPSIIAHIGLVLEDHCKDLGLI